jgi:hypothetical protein
VDTSDQEQKQSGEFNHRFGRQGRQPKP